MNRSKFIGGVLLIVGTSIGGGMLALPMSTAAGGFVNSIAFLGLSWLVMTVGAFLILEVNLRLPPGTNLVSMAQFTLGLPGQILSWVIYLFFLYTLIAAYISGGSDILNGILASFHIVSPASITTLLFTVLFSWVVYAGIRTVDYVNRGLMFGKLSVYLILIVIISPYVNPRIWQGGSIKAITNNLMILVTAFGFASIIPSLRDYFKEDVQTLRKVIFFGSLIPLICYIAWDAVIMGVIPAGGENGLIALTKTVHPTSGLTDALSASVESPWITSLFRFFTSICMITAFLGVSIGLFDFLADGLQLKKSGSEGGVLLTLTFLPPLMVVLLYPGIYLHALNYAGICCVLLLLLLPSLMAWCARKNNTDTANWQMPGGNLSLVFLALTGIFLLYITY
ncbi:MAG: tryptophan/tyrosine permease [Legionella sp.]|nr:tryptophan/tyrosine permease [Legionella sp.]